MKKSLPIGWLETTIEKLFRTIGGGTPSTDRPDFWGNGVPWITSADIDDAGGIRPRKSVTASGIASSATNPVPPGSVVVVTRVGLGKVGLAKQKLCFSQDCQALLFDPELLDPTFVAHQTRRIVRGIRGRGTTIDGVTVRQLGLLPFRLAPRQEQHRIVEAIESFLCRLDEAIATLERVQAKLSTYRASVLKAAVEGRLVPTDASLARVEKREYEPAEVQLARLLKERRRRWEETELARLSAAEKVPKDDKWKARYESPAGADDSKLQDLPEGWCWATADQVGDILLGRQRSQAYLTGKWSRPYLRVANIKDDRIDFGDIEQMDFDPSQYSKYRLEVGDILVSEGQSPHLVGQSAIYRGGVNELCFQKTLHRFRPLPGGPSSEFAQIVFRANVMLGVFKQVAPITTNIAHLTLEKFRASRFPLPPALEQQRIVGEVHRLLSVSEAAEKQVRVDALRMRRLRQAILNWAFDGKLVDQDPSDEPAVELMARVHHEGSTINPSRKGRRRSAKGMA